MQNTASSDSDNIIIRQARDEDLAHLVTLEKACFCVSMQDSPRAIKHGLKSPHQEVWVAEKSRNLAAALFLRLHKRSLRIYSIAVQPSHQHEGLGDAMMRLADKRALALGKSQLILEAQAKDDTLIRWYRKRGYAELKLLPDYYGSSKDALKMMKFVHPSE